MKIPFEVDALGVMALSSTGCPLYEGWRLVTSPVVSSPA